MGNTASASISGAATLDSFIGELGDVTFEKTLNSSRFLKCVRGLHKDGQVIIKVLVKAGTFSLKNAAKQMEREKDLLMSIPNALSYQRLIETDRAAYLVRQYIFSNLYDRISTRPFLELVERRWIIFQLLSGLRECHSHGIHHGDIKTENVLVTSWNWVYLTDFAFFKPTYLPENNPADFSYYFDTSFRRTCYLAPERFHGPSVTKTGHVTDAMDIFSLGCVIAELFLEGSPLFDLSQLLRYKTGDYDPSVLIDRIEDAEVRTLILHMINLNPDKRYSAEEYLQKWHRRIFPNYFSSFLHQYIALITDAQRHHSFVPNADTDDALDRIFFEFDKISFFLGFHDQEKETNSNVPLPVPSLSIPNYRRSPAGPYRRVDGDDGALIFLSILLSGIRNTTRTATRVRACDSIVALSEKILDETKLDRVVPYLITLLTDEAPEVRICSLNSLVQVLAMVSVLTPVNAFMFPEYILPRLKPFKTDSNVMVRIAYAKNVALIAQTAINFMDMAQALRAEGFLTLVNAEESENAPSEEGSFTMLFDIGKQDQRTMINDYVLSLLSDSDAIVKISLLDSLSELCKLFAREQANDVILSHIITYLNDREWLLKAAFFKNVVGLAFYLGRESVEEYILPLLVQSLTGNIISLSRESTNPVDTEDFIIEHVLCTLTSLCEHRLIRSRISNSLISIVARFLVHPNLWIQEAVTGFLVAACKELSLADIHCMIYPQIRQFLRVEIGKISAESILQALRRPLPALVLEHAFKWATSSTNSVFWQSATSQREFSGDFSGCSKGRPGLEPLPSLSSTHYKDGGKFGPSKGPVARSGEDESYLNKLRGFGMKPDDEWKLLALREYISRVSHLKVEMQRIASVSESKDVANVNPTTIFFEQATANGVHNPRFRHPAHDVQSVLRDANLSSNSAKALKPFRRVTSPDKQVVVNSSPRDLLRSDRIRSINISSPSRPGTPELDSVHAALQRVTLNNSASTSRAVSLNGDTRLIAPKGNSLNLPAKALPEVSTSIATAVGQVDHHCVVDETRQDTKERRELITASHTYNGSDINVLNLLDKVYIQNYRETIDDFGPRINAIPPKPSNQSITSTWRPDGTLVAHVQEHSAAINRVVVSPDHVFFVTCSDDGTIKVWDSGKLERNVANRARITYRGLLGSKVKSICFVENSYCIAAVSDTGNIHVIKIDCSVHILGAKYGTMKLARKHQLPAGEVAVVIEHFVNDQKSILVMATNLSRVVALDIRSMNILYSLQNPPNHGSPTTFCLDKRRHWLLLGTSRGILDLWDLRFQLRVKSIGLPQEGPIRALCLHPTRGRGRWVCCASGDLGEITVWDIEKSQCREVYRPLQPRKTVDHEQSRSYQPWDVEASRSEDLLARFSSELSSGSVNDGTRRQPEVRALTLGLDGLDSSKSRCAFIIAASADQKVRLWEVNKVEMSTVITGLEQEDEKPSYASTKTGNLVVNQETETKHLHKHPKSRSQLLAGQQNQLLRNHMDSILDVAFLQWPYPMVISVDRSGVLKVTT